jgi:monoamine oxidase
MSGKVWDVVVVGAGMAGLAAARTLAEAGRSVLVLEATKRVGGRILTERMGDAVVELGAEFVHGRPPELLALIAEAGLTLYERAGDFLQATEAGLECSDADDRNEVLEGLKNYAGPDISFSQYAKGLALPEWQREAATGYVEGFNAADANEASVLALATQQRAEDAIEGDRVWKIREGYDRLPNFLRECAEHAGAEFRFDVKVNRIEWPADSTATVQSGGLRFAARAVVVALPLGVLQAEGEAGLAFEPRPDVLKALAQMRMGHVCRMTMLFRERLWPAQMSFLLSPSTPPHQPYPAVWWTSHPAASLTLTGWIGGPLANAWLDLPPELVQERAVQALADIFSLPVGGIREGLIAFAMHNWRDDPAALGAYSWVPVGGIEASALLAQPVARTLFFAGEHTDTTGHWGTVHAAYGSGLRAARQVLAIA